MKQNPFFERFLWSLFVFVLLSTKVNALEVGDADWTKEYDDPISLAKEVIKRTPTFWTPAGNLTIKGVYRVGSYAAMHGGAYILLESPSLTTDLVTGGFVKVGKTVSWDFILNFIEKGVKTPKVICEKITKESIKQGLDEYEIAYDIARNYIKTKELTESDAKQFLYYRWGVFKLAAARELWNSSREQDYKITEQSAQIAMKEIINLAESKYSKEIGSDRNLSIIQTCNVIRDISSMMDQKEIGLKDFKPYLQFEKRLNYINNLRISEYQRFTSKTRAPNRYRVNVINLTKKTLTLTYDTSGKNIREILKPFKVAQSCPMGMDFGLGNEMYAYESEPQNAKGDGWYAHHVFSQNGETWAIK